MKITDIFDDQEHTFSFEFFPARDEIASVDFGINLGQLMKLSPSFITVTYGAGGSTQEKTFNIVDYIQNKLGITCVAHYTCVNATKDKIITDLDTLYNMGINNLMLLRGDLPKGQTKFIPVEGGCNYASDLIKLARQQHDFCIGAACYPEKHLEAVSLDEDLKYLKLKVDAGVDFLTTQFFFNNDIFFEFIDKAYAAGINCRIIPGILPITNYGQIKRFAELSGATIPAELTDKLETYKNEPQKMYQVGLDFAIKQTKDLLARGAYGLHFYTLNKSRAAVEIFEALSIDLHRKLYKRQYKIDFKSNNQG